MHTVVKRANSFQRGNSAEKIEVDKENERIKKIMRNGDNDASNQYSAKALPKEN